MKHYDVLIALYIMYIVPFKVPQAFCHHHIKETNKKKAHAMTFCT